MQILSQYGIILLAAILLVFGSNTGLSTPTYAQEEGDDETFPPATHARWGMGLQAFPVLGASVRFAVTPRFTMQVAGMPGLGGEFLGTIGGRALYKFLVREGYNLYGSVAAAPFFSQSLEFDDGFQLESRTRIHWYAAITVGAEAALGDHVSLSGEVGGARVWDSLGLGFAGPSFGIGLHFYW